MKNYTHILAMLMRSVDCVQVSHIADNLMYFCRLRRAVLHPSLVLSKENGSHTTNQDLIDADSMIKQFSESNGSAYAENVLDDIKGETECPICLDIAEVSMMIPSCMHRWCVNSSVIIT